MAERAVFGAAVLVVALHATTDAFLAPQPGTHAGDHLVRGLATLALLAGALLLYRCVRAGARAALAAGLGVLALEGGVLAVAEARAVGPRGADWTGFLLLPAGAVLCGLAVVVAWRSRRPRPWRVRVLTAVAALLGAFWLLVPLGMAIGATHRPRASVAPLDLGRPHEEVAVVTADGLVLAGWYVPSRNGAAVISFPTRQGKPEQARMLVRHGYGVLALDMRGYDGSEGDANAFGWRGARDVDAAVAWLRRRPDVRDGRIGGIGFSVGGEQLLEAAAGNPGLRAVVAEGAGIRSYRESLLYGWRMLPSLPKELLQTAALAVMSGSPPPQSLERLAPRIAPRPIFLIYAEHGVGGEELSRRFYAAAHPPKQLWRVPGAQHVGGFEAAARAYERRVVGFFDRALLGA